MNRIMFILNLTMIILFPVSMKTSEIANHPLPLTSFILSFILQIITFIYSVILILKLILAIKHICEKKSIKVGDIEVIIKDMQYNSNELNSEVHHKNSEIQKTNSRKKIKDELHIEERSPNDQQRNEIESERDNPKLPSPQFIIYKKGKFCSLCKIDFIRNVSITVLPCEHILHEKCEENLQTKVCPTCEITYNETNLIRKIYI